MIRLKSVRLSRPPVGMEGIVRSILVAGSEGIRSLASATTDG